MVCDCCGKRRGFLESFVPYDHKDSKVNLCVHCNEMIYTVRDAILKEDVDKLNAFLTNIGSLKEKNSPVFADWWSRILQGFYDYKANIDLQKAAEEEYKDIVVEGSVQSNNG